MLVRRFWLQPRQSIWTNSNPNRFERLTHQLCHRSRIEIVAKSLIHTIFRRTHKSQEIMIWGVKRVDKVLKNKSSTKLSSRWRMIEKQDQKPVKVPMEAETKDNSCWSIRIIWRDSIILFQVRILRPKLIRSKSILMTEKAMCRQNHRSCAELILGIKAKEVHSKNTKDSEQTELLTRVSKILLKCLNLVWCRLNL